MDVIGECVHIAVLEESNQKKASNVNRVGADSDTIGVVVGKNHGVMWEVYTLAEIRSTTPLHYR